MKGFLSLFSWVRTKRVNRNANRKKCEQKEAGAEVKTEAKSSQKFRDIKIKKEEKQHSREMELKLGLRQRTRAKKLQTVRTEELEQSTRKREQYRDGDRKNVL